VSNYNIGKNPYFRKNKSSAKKNVLLFGINMLLWLVAVLSFLIKVCAFVLIYFVYKPGRVISRFIFYRIIVKLYSYYFSLSRRIGWQKISGNIFTYVFHQKAVHILVALVTIFLVTVNMAQRTKAEDLSASTGQTILASLIQNEFSDEDQGALIEETFDQSAIVSPIEQSYLDNLGAMKEQPIVDQGAADEDNDFNEPTVTQGGSALVKPEIASTNETKRARTETVTYSVQDGDTISTIAEKFDIKVSTILWENNLSAYSVIRPGDNLRILPVDGINYEVVKGDSITEIAKNYGVSDIVIISYNKASEGIKIGQKLFIPGGSKKSFARYESESVSGAKLLQNIAKIPITELFKKPKDKPATGNKMSWPTLGARITQYYQWSHHAIDIANKIGTPIYAADSGIVEVIGWGSGYGNQIIIDHGGGKKTRYAHLSKFYVSKGEKVSKGETIAAMGSTGRSTGPHLHFEVMINGTKYNPLNYVR
jgi:murein DD-endopeptidase MepM/ murein hydrolase activator NlpD